MSINNGIMIFGKKGYINKLRRYGKSRQAMKSLLKYKTRLYCPHI